HVPVQGRISLARVQEALKHVTTGPQNNQRNTIQGEEDDHPQLAESGPLIQLPNFNAAYPGVNGAGHSVVIIDTGIDRDHPFFGPDVSPADGIADRIVYSYDFYSTNDPDASDGHGHGSNVAS